VVHYFPDSAVLARRMAGVAGVGARPVDVHRFPDGESLVRLRCDGEREAVLFRSLHHPNEKLIEVLLACDALRRGGVRRVALVAPYLPYMRQDVVFSAGEPISQRVIGALLGEAFDQVLTVEAHLHRIRRLAEVVPCAARSVPAVAAIAEWVARFGRRTLLVGPDAESAPWVGAVARRAGLPCVVAEKQRSGDRRVRVRLPPLPAAGRAVLLDDIASSGATLAATARALRRAGIRRVDALVVHAIMAPGAAARLRRAGVRRLLSCDTVPHPTNAVSVAPLLAQALWGGP
jgi:ribose-phosphate pyrophosphokinase